MKILDFHTHLDDDFFGQPTPGVDEFLAGLDRFGIEAACIATIGGFFGDCRRHNDELAARAQRCPERLFPFVTVNPREGDAALAEMERCLGDPLFRGVKLHPWLQAFAPALVRDTMVDLLRCAARHGVPVMFHDGTPPYSTSFQVAATARWVPEATVVLGHAGLSDYTLAAGELARELPNLYLCACGPAPGDVACLVATAGADKVLFGSDYGFSDWIILAEFLDNVLCAGLDEPTLERVLYRNAARLLGERRGGA